jgi:hypothetical protein
MSLPPVTPQLEDYGSRPFSFYPPILNIEHNEWVYRQGTWSEVLVHNPKMKIEVWVPRRFLGEISRIDEPVMIVGLRKELEYKGGAVWPHERRIIEMPKAVNEGPRPQPPPEGAPRLTTPPASRESKTDSSVSHLVAGALLAGLIACVFLLVMLTSKESGGRVNYTAILQAELGLTAQDDYFAVVRKLGQPTHDRWRSEVGERQYRALDYPRLSVTIILMGAERDKVLYIGAKDKNWKTVHSVDLPGGTNSASIMRNLPPF